jgi:16S rRNA processing protein RimM
MAGRVQLGHVVRAHGVRGEVRVLTGSDAIASLKRVFVGEREMRVLYARADGIVRFDGVADRDQADALRGQPIFALRDEMPPAGEGEVYVADLVGCELVDAAGAALGVVTSTYPTPAHEILVIKRGDAEFLVPMVPEIITAVDLTARRLVCEAPEGLFDS